MESAHHFVKLNSTAFATTSIVMFSILLLEIILIIVYCILWPFVCLAVYRAGVMHRNFRTQICLASSYLCISQIARLIMIYYQLWDIALEPDNLMYLCDLIKVTVLGYYCSLMGSFAVERSVATHYWEWYDKGSTSTLLVLLTAEAFMLVPNFIEAILNLNGIVSIESNFYLLVVVFVFSSMAFLCTYHVNVRLHKNLSQGAQLDYSVSRTFQVRENVIVMKYMFDIMIPPLPFALAAFVAFSVKMFGSTDWQLTRDISYALYDLLIAIFCSIHQFRTIVCNSIIYREFSRIASVFCFNVHGYQINKRH